jgi:hypothetical protein
MSNNDVIVKVGDLVTLCDKDEFLFLDRGITAQREVLRDIFWNGSVGVVLKVGNCLMPHKVYSRVLVVVDETVGWTYSDHLKIVQR